MTIAHNVYIIQVIFKRPISESADALLVLKKSIVRPIMDAQDTPYSLSFVERQPFGAVAMLKRFESIGKHEDIKVVRVIPTSVNQASSLGILDPITSKVEVAWGKNAKALEAKNLERRNGVAVNKRKGTRRKTRAERRRDRQSR